MILPERAADMLQIIAARTSAEIERTKSETERKTLENRLQQAPKMEAIGALAGGIAHDFNNVLAAIIGYTELAKADAPAESNSQENLEEVLIAGHRAKELVNQILAFSRQGEIESIPIQMQSLVRDGLKMIRSSGSIPKLVEILDGLPLLCNLL